MTSSYLTTTDLAREKWTHVQATLLSFKPMGSLNLTEIVSRAIDFKVVVA